MKKCPYCKEEIQDVAVKCKHCHEIIPSGSDNQSTAANSKGGGGSKASWVFGVLFALAALGFLTMSVWASLVYLTIAAFLLPPVRAIVGKKTGIAVPRFARVVAILALLVIAATIQEKRLGSYAEEQAQEGGFESVAAYQEARKAGVSTEAQYEEKLARQEAQQGRQRAERAATLKAKLLEAQDLDSRVTILAELVELEPDEYIHQVELAQAKDDLQNAKEEYANRQKEALEANRLENQPWYRDSNISQSCRLSEWMRASNNEQLKASADYIRFSGGSRFDRDAAEWKRLATRLNGCIYQKGKMYDPEHTLFMEVAKHCSYELSPEW